MIKTVKIQGKDYLVNGTLTVPKVEGNRHYELVKEWLKTNTPEPEFTQAQLDEQALAAKWAAIADFWASLTVTINGNKYKADEAGSNRMALKRDALAADGVCIWYESWGSFETNKVDLQDAVIKADADLQAFIDATMGAA